MWGKLVVALMETSPRAVNELARACAHTSDPAEWEQFLRLAMPLVSMAASRVCRMWTNNVSRAMVDDIAQEVFLKLCEQDRRILREFVPRGEDSFFGLLRTVTVSVANDYLRRGSSAKRGGKVVTFSLDDDSSSNPSPGVDSSRDLHQSVLLAQLDQMLRSAPEVISERDRTMFWLYYLQGFTAEEISRVAEPGLSPKGVESALRRICNWIRSEIDHRRAGPLIRAPQQEPAS